MGLVIVNKEDEMLSVVVTNKKHISIRIQSEEIGDYFYHFDDLMDVRNLIVLLTKATEQVEENL